MIPFLRGLVKIIGNVDLVNYHSDFPMTSADGIFASVANITSNLLIRATKLTSLANAFPTLLEIGGDVVIAGNTRLASLSGAFANVQAVGRSIAIAGNSQIATLDGAFLSLRSVGRGLFVSQHRPRQSRRFLCQTRLGRSRVHLWNGSIPAGAESSSIRNRVGQWSTQLHPQFPQPIFVAQERLVLAGALH